MSDDTAPRPPCELRGRTTPGGAPCCCGRHLSEHTAGELRQLGASDEAIRASRPPSGTPDSPPAYEEVAAP